MRSAKMNWLGLETRIRLILSSGDSAVLKLYRINYAVAAYTGRGDPGVDVGPLNPARELVEHIESEEWEDMERCSPKLTIK